MLRSPTGLDALRKALQGLVRSQPADASQEVAADPSVATMDLCRLPSAKAEAEKLAKTATGPKKRSGTRPILLDSGCGAKLASAQLSEADFRGERAKDYLKAGVDICCTNTLKANAFGQKDYKTGKFVTEMNKAAASHLGESCLEAEVAKVSDLGLSIQLGLAKRAAAEVTKQDVKKPRFVAGVDLLALEMNDARQAKAALAAGGKVYRQMKQRPPPVIIHAVIDPSTGRTMGGQTADAFYISVKHARPLAVGELPNFVGIGTDGLPANLASLSGLQRPTRPLPEAKNKLMLSGLESHVADGFTLVGQRGSTRAFGCLGSNDALGRSKALDLCAADNNCGADILEPRFWYPEGAYEGDICVDGVANDGSNRGSKVLMNKFTNLCDADARVAKSPVMLCSSDWKVVKEGLGNLQGRCIVNAICLMVGEEEFLQLAKDAHCNWMPLTGSNF
eukprot:Skav209717  [mRNA]  locus=scaffold528:119170:133719:- [translate_table: standard]